MIAIGVMWAGTWDTMLDEPGARASMAFTFVALGLGSHQQLNNASQVRPDGPLCRRIGSVRLACSDA